MVVPRPTREFATIGRVLTSAQAGAFVSASKYKKWNDPRLFSKCPKCVSLCASCKSTSCCIIKWSKVLMVRWSLETGCFRQPDSASVSQDLEPFEGVQSHVLYADSPVLFLAHANLRHHSILRLLISHISYFHIICHIEYTFLCFRCLTMQILSTSTSRFRYLRWCCSWQCLCVALIGLGQCTKDGTRMEEPKLKR